MIIEKVVIKNYKMFENFTIEFNEDVNIIIGDNETGKTTLLEAINLALTLQLNGRHIQYELSPYLFNTNAVQKYINELQSNAKTQLPKILIEVYFKENDAIAFLKGTNNTLREDKPGIYFEIVFDNEYLEEYKAYIQNPKEVRTIPVEYYEIKWYSFANNTFKFTQLPVKTLFINNIEHRYQNGPDKYIANILEEVLEKSENALLSLNYRKLKEGFAEEESIKKINEKLSQNKDDVTDKDIKISIDISTKTNWDTNLILYLDDVPFKFIGKGEQNSVKMKLALQSKMKRSNIIMIEEPETNLSFTNMSKLVNSITKSCENKQLFITTHSSFVMNKTGVNKVIFLNNGTSMSMKDISKDTQNYFMKLPGYDTLRMIIASKSILVEGPSDELIVQRAYKNQYGKLPIEDGIDVISVGSLAFKRFLEIAKKLNKEVIVVTDNDKDINKLKNKYKDYIGCSNIKICYSNNESLYTLELQILNCNDLDVLNSVFDTNYKDKEALEKYMLANKTKVALEIFEKGDQVVIPEYIRDAIS